MTPYIVTVKRHKFGKFRSPLSVESRRAIATLDEAKRATRDAGAYAVQADAIDESGGTVGPLADGTVIEVVPTGPGR